MAVLDYERLDRQLRIEGWDQHALDRAKIAVVADGGLLPSIFIMCASALGINSVAAIAPELEPSLIHAARRLNTGLDLAHIKGLYTHPALEDVLEGAGIIFVPSHIHGKAGMWKGPVIEGHVRSRAAENGRYVVFVNAAGPEQNVPSMIADPRGELIARCRRGVRQLLVARLDLRKVNDDFLLSRRTDLYPLRRPRKR